MSLVSGYPQHFGGPPAPEALHSPYFPGARYDPAAGYSPLSHATPPEGAGHYFSAWPFHSASPHSPEPSPTSTVGSDYSPPPPPYHPAPSPAGSHATLQVLPHLHAPRHGDASTTGHHASGSFSGGSTDLVAEPVRPIRAVKRRVTANRKERRRTQFINSAFAKLRGCIPHVPADTKLSKIKTLRLATSYIAYLMDVLAHDDPADAGAAGFKADLAVKKLTDERSTSRKREMIAATNGGALSTVDPATGPCGPLPHGNQAPDNVNHKKSKGRTGWPQHVWALELKHDR